MTCSLHGFVFFWSVKGFLVGVCLFQLDPYLLQLIFLLKIRHSVQISFCMHTNTIMEIKEEFSLRKCKRRLKHVLPLLEQRYRNWKVGGETRASSNKFWCLFQHFHDSKRASSWGQCTHCPPLRWNTRACLCQWPSKTRTQLLYLAWYCSCTSSLSCSKSTTLYLPRCCSHLHANRPTKLYNSIPLNPIILIV